MFTYLTFKNDSNSFFTPCFCPTKVSANARKQYMAKEYKAKCTKEEPAEWAYFDAGGMTLTTLTPIEFRLSKKGGIKVHPWHWELLKEALESRINTGKFASLPGVKGKYIRLSSWPGTLVYLSVKDATKLLKMLRNYTPPVGA